MALRSAGGQQVALVFLRRIKLVALRFVFFLLDFGSFSPRADALDVHHIKHLYATVTLHVILIYVMMDYGSILCDPIQPSPSTGWPNPTQPKPIEI